MNKCKTCIHWEKTTNYDSDIVPNDGICTKILEKLFVSIRFDGYLNYIETEDDFGCMLWEDKR